MQREFSIFSINFICKIKALSFAIAITILEKKYQVHTFLSLNKTVSVHVEFDVLPSYVCTLHIAHCAMFIFT